VINDFAGVTGGTDRVALTEAAELARRGHDVTLIAGHGETDPDLLDAGVTVHRTGQHATLSDPRRVRAAAQGVWNRPSRTLVHKVLASADRGDTLVHVHGFVKVLSPSVVRAAVDSGLPTVVTLHDYFAACPNGGFFNYQTNEVCHLTPLSPRCIATNCDARSYSHKLWRVARAGVQRWAAKMPSGVRSFIAPSRLAGEILAPFLPAGATLHILPNAATDERLPAVDPSANRPFVFVGRLQPDKGPVVFADAARQANVAATFVGSGDLSQAIRDANPQAQLTGWLSAEQVQAVIRGARAVVNASLWYETQGLSAHEAAANGIPAIVSDVTVLRDAVVDEVTGLWFRGGDVEDLADKLRTLDADAEMARRLGREAYDRFWANPSDQSRHVDELEGIYGVARALAADPSARG
jgi:glycosyltransferase involved in cell wall biosynthesis